MSRAPLAARLLRRWHKRLGLVAAAFFAFLALTGLILNHGDSLDLDSTRVGAPWLMAWYGLKPALPEQCFLQEEGAFCWQGDTWVLAGRRLKAGSGEPVGAVRIGDLTWVATADAIHLYDPEGRAVDKIERELLPAVPIRRIGVHDGQLAANIGPAVYASADGITWERLAGDGAVAWSRLKPLRPDQQRELAPLFAPSLPLQRIVADFHSGRIFGHYGVFVTDALAVFLFILAGSGLWLHFGNRSKKDRRARAAAPAGHEVQGSPR